jgi:predicted RND superfamily exporter protein
MVLLGVAFRRISGVVIPMAVKGISLVWTMGIYALTGHALNPITALLPPLIIVLSISTSVHLYSEWLSAAGPGDDRNRLVVLTARNLFAPCMYTALTTALGLLSLLVSRTPAVRQFGIFGALGVLVSFAVSITLVPIALSSLPMTGTERSGRPAGSRNGIVRMAARIAGNRPWWVVAGAVCLSIAGIAGIAGIRNNTDLVRFLKPGAPLYRDTMFVDRNLAGVYSLEFLLSRRDGMPLTAPEDLRKIYAFKEMAARQPHVAAAYSIADPLLLIHRAETGSRNAGLPSNEEDLLYDFDLMRADREHSFIGKLMTEDLTGARISVRVHAVGTMEAAPLVSEMEANGKKLLGESYLLVPTGSFYQITRDSNLLVKRQGISLALCLAAIPAAVYLLFRSASLTAVALIPTLIPVLLTGGLMGILGIDLSTGTAMIFPIVLGLGVDNTIHYLARYRRESAGGECGAVERTTVGIGRPLAASTLILAFGFGAGAFGSFKPTIHFSLLTAGAMIASLACALLVLPACLELADRAKRRTSP